MDVRIRFNDMPTQPTWWTKEVELAFLVPILMKSWKRLSRRTKDLQHLSLSLTEKRKIALNTKEYISEHGITEKNGDPMEIPVY
ncbi:MAG: hypothetical protein ACLU4J_15025 [Butyricimonas paravirosa]